METPTPGEAKNLHPCKVCSTPDPAKPMTFVGTDACCELHRKMIDGEIAWPTQPDPNEPPGRGGVTDTRSF